MEAGSCYAQVKHQGSSVDSQLSEHSQSLGKGDALGKEDTLSRQRSPQSKNENRSEETDSKKDVPPERYVESGMEFEFM